MAVVYTAMDKLSGQRVAIKQMGSYAQTPEEAVLAAQQFEQEARLLHSLHHPNIPRVHEWFEEGLDHCLVMDFIEGHHLTSRSDGTGKTTVAKPVEVVGWAIQLARALTFLHEQKPRPIIYKDLKPDNLMVETDGTIKMLDFGIAKGRDAQGRYFTLLKGMVTPGFAAPEQYAGTATDPRADIYGFGATLYALLTGEPPPEAVARQQDILSGKRDPLVPLRQVNPAVSPELEDVIMQMLALRRTERLQSAEVARVILEQVPEADRLREAGQFPHHVADTANGAGQSDNGGGSAALDPARELQAAQARLYSGLAMACAALVLLCIALWFLHGG